MIKLIIGGGGFLGSHIVKMLMNQGQKVRVFGPSKYTRLEEMGVECIQGDISSKYSLISIMENVDTVFHVAAKAEYWGNYSDFWKINVEGTQNVIDAMKIAKVKKLIYTSSPSVVGFNKNLTNIGQDFPYPNKYECYYPQTKAAGEKLVLEANGPNLATLAIRPHMIFGPEERHVFLPMIKRAHQNNMIRIGNGKNCMDLTYVDNAAAAHLDAEKALTSYQAPCAGKAYFISNDEPVVFYDHLNEMLTKLNIGSIKKSMPRVFARFIGFILEKTFRIFSLKGKPPITPYVANMMAFDHWYDMEPAKRDLNYKVRISMKEGTLRTIEWLNNHKPWL